MATLVGRIFSGHLRSIIGSMTVEAIIREQQTLADAILDASTSEMARIGLAVDSCRSAVSTTRAPVTSRPWPPHTRQR